MPLSSAPLRRRAVLLAVLGMAIAGCAAQDAIEPPISDEASAEEVSAPSTDEQADQGSAPDLDDDAALAAVVESRRADDDVCGAPPEFGELPGDGFERLVEQDGQVLVAVTCEFFAYQGSYVFMGWDGQSLSTVEVEQYVDGEVVVSNLLLGLPGVEPGGFVSNFEKGAGAGYCGSWQSWFYDGTSLFLDQVRERSCEYDGEYAEPDQWELVYGIEGTDVDPSDGQIDTAGEDPESFLEYFATVWGANDEGELYEIASADAVTEVLSWGPGEANVVWDEERCGVQSPGEGSCEALFMPEGQTECCGLIFEVQYTNDENGQLFVTGLLFQGDAG